MHITLFTTVPTYISHNIKAIYLLIADLCYIKVINSHVPAEMIMRRHHPSTEHDRPLRLLHPGGPGCSYYNKSIQLQWK